jgi:hypothetical protein
MNGLKAATVVGWEKHYGLRDLIRTPDLQKNAEKK